jgi:hypothetical protein
MDLSPPRGRKAMRWRYGLCLPEPMADRLGLTASTRHVSKFQILEKSVTERVARDGHALDLRRNLKHHPHAAQHDLRIR